VVVQAIAEDINGVQLMPKGGYRRSKTARKVELYSTAYKLALVQIPDVQRREKPDISLRIHASIRRQLKEGETDPIRMAFVALKDVLVPETH